MKVFNRSIERANVEVLLSKITPNPQASRGATVSYNAPVDEANAKCANLESQGYLIVETYGDDFDCGQHLEYALHANKGEVIEKHIKHLERCFIGDAIHNNLDYQIVD